MSKKLYFHYGAMNAGKSAMLLQTRHNYRERHMDVLVYIPKIAEREKNNAVVSRVGIEAEARPIGPDFDIFQDTQHFLKQKNISAILVDEAQFLSKAQVFQLLKITLELDLPVLTYGLRSDFRGEAFEGSKYLLLWADSLVEIKTICHCGRKATMTIRVSKDTSPVKDGNQIEVGDNSTYIAVCHRHFLSETAIPFPTEVI